jgi:hypothetical protein
VSLVPRSAADLVGVVLGVVQDRHVAYSGLHLAEAALEAKVREVTLDKRAGDNYAERGRNVSGDQSVHL